ncbi:MAG: agmatinase [Rhodothalassiaceae bacterium]
MPDLIYRSADEGFLGLTGEDAVVPEAARAAIVPYPLEASVSYGGGTAAGPEAILQASHQVELFDEEFWCEPFRAYGVATLVPPRRIEPALPAAIAWLESAVGQLMDQGKFPLVLGGEHSLTPGPVRAAAARHGGLVIVQIDAHADLRDGYDGEPYSHAAALRRCLDDPALSLVSLGIRNISAEEIPFYESNKDRIHIHWAKDRPQWDLAQILEPLEGRPVYLTVDLDGFDSSLMPATGTPEPGGLFWDDMMAILAGVCQAGELVGADIVELAPKPDLHACDFLAAKLAYKILNHRFAGR